MAVKDVLLALRTYPEPTPVQVVDDAVALAALLGAHLSAVACETHVEVPSSVLPTSMINIPALIAEEARKSRQNAQDLLAAFEAAASGQGVPCEAIFERGRTDEVPGILVEYARLRDLTIISVPDGGDRWDAEAIMFGSGRPTLVLPERPHARPLALNTVVVAWDFSRAAARAVSDALPLLERAGQVRIVTVSGEKKIDTSRSAEELARNLARHGIDVVLDEVRAEGRTIGDVLAAHAASCSADVLVMGAYGHSRFREFILGGATRSLLASPPLPILFSH
jgi:nucleotide-binding universal stress UspA family protein